MFIHFFHNLAAEFKKFLGMSEWEEVVDTRKAVRVNRSKNQCPGWESNLDRQIGAVMTSDLFALYFLVVMERSEAKWVNDASNSPSLQQTRT